MQTKFSSSTPININDLELEEVLDYINDNGDPNIASPKVRLRLTEMLYDVLGLNLTPDVALATVTEPPAALILSTAGGGKTTFAQIKAILQKLMRKSVYHKNKKIRGDAILCLVYNKHNVSDMINKHRDMVARLEARGIKGLDIDSEIHACTLHSFCDFWRREYVAAMDLLGASLLEQSQAESYMRRAIKIACKQLQCEKQANKIDPADAFALYTYYRETLCEDINDLEGTAKFVDLGVDIELLEAIFARYERSKQMQHKYDFVDMLYKFYCLMKDNDKVRERIQTYYEYVIADEVQDFTPLMWKILQLMVSDGTPLTCIGDEDQNIYSFRGADIYNTLQFDTMFNGGKIYSLEYNRRCGKEILDEARKVIEMNTLRFNKVLRNTKPGGKVVYEPYNSLNGQFVNVLKLIKSIPQEDLHDTVICYREGVSSTILSDMLMQEDIVFNVISGVGPFSHELYRHMFDIFDALEVPYDMRLCINLYKVLPCNREEYFDAIGYDAATGKFKHDNVRGTHFKDFNYGKLGERKSFSEVIDKLALISSQIEKRPVSELALPVFELLNKYFWGFKKTCNRFPEVDEIMQARVLKYFQSPLMYAKFYQEYQRIKSRYKSYTDTRDGLTISTFHSLKGLEFKNVIVICMDDVIFPNFGLISSKSYSKETALALKEAETRLWYVAVTRAKEYLHVFYYKANPSVYVQYALQNCFPVAGVFPETPIGRIGALGLLDSSEFNESNVVDESVSDEFDEFDDFSDFADIDDLESSTVQGSDSPQLMPFDDLDDDGEVVEAPAPSEQDAELGESASLDDIHLEAFDTLATSNNANLWANTQDLVSASRPIQNSANDSEIAEGTKDSKEVADQESAETVQLRSGKNIYLQKLLNSL